MVSLIYSTFLGKLTFFNRVSHKLFPCSGILLDMLTFIVTPITQWIFSINSTCQSKIILILDIFSQELPILINLLV